MDIETGNFSFLTAFLIFSIYFFIDILYANYTFAVVEKRAGKSATISAVMYFLLAVGVLSYIENPLYLIPLAAGAWTGTFVAVKRHRKDEG